MGRFLLKFSRVKIHSGEDKLALARARDGNFSIKNLYNELELEKVADCPSKGTLMS